MRAVLVDTDILIEVSRGRNGAVIAAWEALAIEAETLLALTPVTVAELWRGVREPERKPLGEEYMRRFGPSHAVELADAVIAAVAVEHGMQLWTRSRRHYPLPEMVRLITPRRKVDTPHLTWVAPCGRAAPWLRSPAAGGRSAQGAC